MYLGSIKYVSGERRSEAAAESSSAFGDGEAPGAETRKPGRLRLPGSAHALWGEIQTAVLRVDAHANDQPRYIWRDRAMCGRATKVKVLETARHPRLAPKGARGAQRRES